MRLEVTEPAQKDLAELNEKNRGRIKGALDRFISHPQAADLKKLKGGKDMWRLRVGDLRIILRWDLRQHRFYRDEIEFAGQKNAARPTAHRSRQNQIGVHGELS
ncbi:MAG: type II toxin-antitoxin system RelE family toxin [Desulfotomaculales bacterium]